MSDTDIVKVNKLKTAITLGQITSLGLTESSIFPNYSFSVATPDLRAPPQGQTDQHYSTDEVQNQSSLNRVSARTGTDTDISIAEAADSTCEVAACDHALTNRHKEGIFDIGWWNNGSALDDWDYPNVNEPNFRS
jgi:hypothetical protein